MAISCIFGRHSVADRGVRNGQHEFGRCDRCRCDMMRNGSAWKRVPKGYKVVWRPRTGNALADEVAGQAAVGREVNLKGVTVVGERRYGAQRFALVILNANDERSYAGGVDRLGTSGAVAAQMEIRIPATASVVKPHETGGRLSDMVDKEQLFDWERKSQAQKALNQPS